MTDRHFTQLPPLGLYIHLPWCVRKCPYCDFNSHELRTDAIPEAAYVDALLADLTDELPRIWGRQPVSLFIGGGTPSLFSAAALDRLLSGIRALTALPPDAEITLEANPGTVDDSRFAEYHAIGINRLSIGVQSFDAGALELLGRIHSPQDAQRALERAHAAGFEEINIDLMFGLPGQTAAAARADLDAALALSPTHLSWYELTLEPNTRFARFPPTLPDEDTLHAIQSTGLERLATAGFERYEISAFATARHRCRHNLNYWLFGDYLGIGAGAHGKISRADSADIVRRWKTRHPKAYLQAGDAEARAAGERTVSLEETALEFMMNALRLTDGFPANLYEDHTGTSLHPWREVLASLVERELLDDSEDRIRPTATGLLYLNDVLAAFMQTPPSARHGVIPIHPA